MSNRFHNKFHRHNHHSLSSVDPDYPDAGFDPIASYSSPFRGEFFSLGDIVTVENISGKNAGFTGDVTVVGNLDVLGNYSYIDTTITATSSVHITNSGTLTALTVIQQGEYPVAHFFDDSDTAFFVSGSSSSPGFVGIGTASPNKKLTVVGDVSASGTLFLGSIGPSLTSTNLVVEENGQIKSRNASAIFSSNVDVNYIPKLSSVGSGFINSSIYDDGNGKIGIQTNSPGSTLTVQGDISASGSLRLSNLTTNLTSMAVLVTESGEVQSRNITSLINESKALTANLNANYVPKLSSGGFIFEDSSLYVNGTGDVGIKTDSPNSTLTVAGTISSSSDIHTNGSYLSGGIDLLNIIQDLLTFKENLTVNLKPGSTFGKYKNLDVIPSLGKTAKEVIEMAVFEHVEPVITSFTLEKSPFSLLPYETDTEREKGNVYSKITATINRENFPLTSYKIQRIDSISGVWSTLSSISVIGDPGSVSFMYEDNDTSLSACDFINYRIEVIDSYQNANLTQTHSAPINVILRTSIYVGVYSSLTTLSELSSFLQPIVPSNTNAFSLSGIVNNGVGDYTYVVAPLSKGTVSSVTWNSINITPSLTHQAGTFVGTNVYGVSDNYVASRNPIASVLTDLHAFYW